jgi:transcriptional regulator with XRE-family HTH domain
MKMHVGEKLKHFREERNLSQVDMSLLLGIPETTYSRYERNET